MNTIELAVADTSIKSLPAMANLASVLGNYHEGKIWLIENHLNMVSYYLENTYTLNDERNFWIDFSMYDGFYVGRTWETCWMLRKKTHIRDYIDEKWDTFSHFCIDSIERGYYIFATINTTYISDYGWSGRHQIFIHGYNYDTGMFLCSDFFGKDAKYCRKWIDADKISFAYKHLSDVSHIDDFDGVCLWKYDSHTFSYDIEYGVRNLTSLDLRHVRNILQKYLNGESERGMSGTNVICYGIHIYDALKRYLRYCNTHKCIASVQPIYLVNDHLSILVMLLNMIELGDETTVLYKCLTQLQSTWDKITMNILKYDVYMDIGKTRDQMVNNIYDQIDDYVYNEQEFIIQLICSLECRT